MMSLCHNEQPEKKFINEDTIIEGDKVIDDELN